MTSSIKLARKLAAEGFQVFPLIPNGKTPAVAGFKSKASDKPEEFEKLWLRYNADGEPGHDDTYNVGVYTGRYRDQHLLVLDVDTKAGKLGMASLDELQEEFGQLPETYTVQTASGGLHYYFLTQTPVRCSASRIGKDLDVRGEGGYVVGPGSAVNGNTYDIIRDVDMASAPDWLVEKAGRPKKKDVGQAVAELDTGIIVDKATRYLIESAPEAIEGAGGDETTYRVACAVADFGVSEVTCLNLLVDIWNPLKAHPQWEPEDLEKKVENAYRYRENQVGSRNPQDAFKNAPLPVHKPVGENKEPTFVPQPLGEFNEKDIPPRVWVLGHFLIEGVLSVLIAPPGVGKSTLTLQWGMALVTGNPDIAGAKVHTPGPVLFINNEDDNDELRRRLAAARRFFEVGDRAKLDQLYFYSGVEKPFIIGGKTEANGMVERGLHMVELVNFIKAHNIKCVVVDPFVETHRADENDNQQINTIARFYREVATRCRCSVLLVHHTRKPPNSDSSGHIGNMDSGRGASSLTGAARVVITLHEMSKDDAEQYGIPAKERGRYARLDDAKANFSPKDADASWFRKEGVKLANGDEVGVLKSIKLKAKEEMVLDEVFDAFVNWPEFSELRSDGEISLASAAKILTDGRVFCGAKQGEDGGFPTDKTVLRHLRKLVKDDDRLIHGRAEVWTSATVINGRETRLLHIQIDEESEGE